MPSDVPTEVKFDIGHVLFIDIVGYSRLLITGQSDQLEKLRKIVRGTEQFRGAEAEGKLLRLPTGDGGALVFRTNPEAPVLCALEISKALKGHPEIKVRMGIHSGPVNEVTDLKQLRHSGDCSQSRPAIGFLCSSSRLIQSGIRFATIRDFNNSSPARSRSGLTSKGRTCQRKYDA